MDNSTEKNINENKNIEEGNSEKDLQKILEEGESNEHIELTQEVFSELKKKVFDLEKVLKDKEDIAKNSQYQYIMVKSEFDEYKRITEKNIEDMKLQNLLDIMKKVIKNTDQLRIALTHKPDELQDNPYVKGIDLVYQGFENFLESMYIFPIVCFDEKGMGIQPDFELHEPIATKPVSDESQKNIILEEIEKGYIYIKGDIRKVLKPAKVIVGS